MKKKKSKVKKRKKRNGFDFRLMCVACVYQEGIIIDIFLLWFSTIQCIGIYIVHTPFITIIFIIIQKILSAHPKISNIIAVVVVVDSISKVFFLLSIRYYNTPSKYQPLTTNSILEGMYLYRPSLSCAMFESAFDISLSGTGMSELSLNLTASC